MAVPFSNTKLRVPKGFQNILEGLAREVLRNQPENPFEFGAKYFEQLLRVRDETGHDPAVHGARLEDRFYNNDSFKSPSVDANSPQQQEAALKIQTNYRKHDAEQKVAAMKEEEAAEKIQAGFRGFQDRQQFSESKGDNKEEEEEVDIDLNDPDVEKAAVKIQAGFKGFKARQEIKDLKESKTDQKTEEKVDDKKEEEEVDIDLKDPEVEKAALKIQAGFKGMQARQEIKAMKDAQESEKKVETEEEAVDIDLNDPETEKAALKIQAGFKGFQTRKEIQAKKDAKSQETKETTEEKTEEKKEEEEKVDIDLNDPEVEKAATKIQAGFKGFKTRQEIKSKKESGTDVKEGEETEKAEEQTEEAKPADTTEG